jgi:hypothetical protein
MLDIRNVQGHHFVSFVFDAILNKLTVLLNVNLTNNLNSFRITLPARNRICRKRARIEVYQVFRDFQRLSHNLLNFFARLFEPTWLFLRLLLIFPKKNRKFINLFQIQICWFHHLQKLGLIPVVSRNLERIILLGRNTHNYPLISGLLYLHPFSPPYESLFL